MHSVHEVEFVLNIPRRRGYDRVLVRAIAGEIKTMHVEELRGAVLSTKADEGWIVTERRIAQSVRDKAQQLEREHLFAYTFDELIEEYADFSHYFEWLEKEVKDKEIEKYFAPLAGRVDDLSREGEPLATSLYNDLDLYLDQWLVAPDKEHISILGEFGTGKTWLTLHYAYRLMNKYREAQANNLPRPRIPLIIQLRNYARGFKDVGALLSEFVFREHEIGLSGYRAFEQLNRMGRLLLIFDGFDEMAERTDQQKMVDNFWEIAKVVVPGSKVILSCRTEYFHYGRQEREVLSGELRAYSNTIVLDAPRFEVVYLELFREEQIRWVLARRAAPEIVEKIMGNRELVSLAHRPILIEFILEALPKVEEGKPTDMAHIYYYAARRKMERDITQKRTFTSLADKLYFLCELSWEMLSRNHTSLSYRLFPDCIRHYFGVKVTEVEQDYWHHDLLGQTMLVRDVKGDYSPAHRSLLEFFVAYKFAAEMGVLDLEFLEAAREQSSAQIDLQAESQDYTWSAYFRRERDVKGEMISIPPLRHFICEPMERLAGTVGKQPLSTAVVNLMKDMLTNVESLWGIIEATRNKADTEVGYVGANAATVLNRVGISFRGKNLVNTVLSKADLTRVDLIGADLSGAILWGVTLREASLGDAILRHADMSGGNAGSVRFFRMGRIDALAFSKDGNLIASGSEDGIIRVWGVTSGQQIFALYGHSGWIPCIAYSPDGTLIASGSGDRTVRMWDVETRQVIWTGLGHTDNVNGICFTPDGKRLVSVGGDQMIRIWDVQTGSELRAIHGHENVIRTVAMSPNGKSFATGGWDQNIKLWDVETGEQTALLMGHDDYVRSVAYSPDGNHLVSGSNDMTAILWDLNCREWDVRDNRCAWRLPHDDGVRGVVFSQDSEYIATACWDRIGVRIWKKKSVLALKRGDVPVRSLTGHSGGEITVTWSPDGKLLASGGRDNSIRLWNTSNAECLQVISQKPAFEGLNIRDIAGLTKEEIAWLKSFGAVDGTES